MKKTPVIAVVGPTASGKTALAVELALAVGGEVISADSMQIYKGMDVATAKPTAEEMKGVKHRMLDFLPVTQSYSVAAYVEDAAREIAAVTGDGKVPIVCGGTGLYVDGLLGNMSYVPVPDCGDVRQQLIRRCDEQGAESLLAELRRVDPAYAATLHVNNRIRIIRALEIYYRTGRIPSEVRAQALEYESPYETLFIGLDYLDRNVLYDRIDRRVDIMAENGLVGEARQYAGLSSGTAVQAIGYKELAPYFAGKCSLAEALDSLRRATRHYAKRQLTWFRRNENVHWLYPDENGFGAVIGEAVRLSEEFIKRERMKEECV